MLLLYIEGCCLEYRIKRNISVLSSLRPLDKKTKDLFAQGLSHSNVKYSQNPGEKITY